MKKRKLLAFILVLWGLVLTLASFYYLLDDAKTSFISPLSMKQPTKTQSEYEKYAFPILRNKPANPAKIEIKERLSEQDEFASYLFEFTTEGKRMTGQLNVPLGATPSAGFPVIVMLRGFVNPEEYETGVGTRNAAAFFAAQGYVTVAPDFFGYGGSEMESSDVMTARLEKPKNIIDLLASLTTLEFIDDNKVGMWAHSNGGQIALSVLEITGKSIPTSLWAPVSVSFPYSILYFTNDTDDQGKALRKVLAEFEANNDAFDFSIDRYFNWIQAPILLHHGSADEAAPIEWSETLQNSLKQLDKEVVYYRYEGADHNLRPSWNEVVIRDLEFFNQKVKDKR
jgi:dipeptidyl aminopeptidase/acylaminoacyl peptidase